MNTPNTLSTALAILSAMIAPVVLISACASLAISTSNRLGRTIDRTRKLIARFEELGQSAAPKETIEDENVLVFEQLNWSTRRSRLLHRALASLYLSLSAFVASSIILGFTALANEEFAWIPLLIGMIGALFLFYTSMLLIAETRVAHIAINSEMDFALKRVQLRASPEMLARLQKQRRHLLSQLFR